jgi:two-component system nitrogen regulation sensor histidine kinase NtrY
LHDAPQDFDNGQGAMIRVILPYEETAAVDADKNKSKEMSHGV